MRSLLLLAVSPSVALFDTFWMEEPQEQLYSLNGAPIPDYGGDPSWLEWEDGPNSAEEFDHGNPPELCDIRRATVEEWEAEKLWEGIHPIIVMNVTDGWAANTKWKKQEMLHHYPDAEATMGATRIVGDYGPDAAGKHLTLTTLKEFITEHMYHHDRYFFDRKIAIPEGMLKDCHFPMPTRRFLEDPDKAAGAGWAPSKKAKVRKIPAREVWRDHLAISIGADLQGLTLHHHREAWNIVIFGAKRWILWDNARWKNNSTRQAAFARDPDGHQYRGHEWIQELLPSKMRQYEIINYGYDCIQRAGEMMFVPERWMHMVVNIGDTVSVISEIGLGIGEGKKPEDFLYDPLESSSSDDEEEWSSDDEDEYGNVWDSEDEEYVHPFDLPIDDPRRSRGIHSRSTAS